MSINVLDEAVTVGVIMGMAEVVKKLGLPDRYIPVWNIALGVAIQAALVGTPDVQSVLQGVVAGLVASGTYRSYKVVVKGE